MIISTDIDKIKRFCLGESDKEEERYVWSLFSEKEEDDEFKQYIHKEFEKYFDTHTDENYHLSFMIDHIHNIINQKKQHQKKEPFVKKVYQWYSVAAAILLVPMIIAGIFWQNNISKTVGSKEFVTNEIVAPFGARVNFSLPDGTKGCLNSGSSLKYKIPFCKNRKVSVEGEASFDVAHDSKHPFELSAGVSIIKVLGTKFNIHAYQEEHSVEVVLEEGKVNFSVYGLSKNVVMKPNDRLFYIDGVIYINQVNAAKYMAWSEGKLIFQGDPMKEVARRISRWYNVEVVLMDKLLESYRIRGTFQDDPLKEVLTVLTMTSPIRYKIIEGKTLEDGTHQKQKILLYKN